MKKQIRQITGTSIGITFTKQEQETYGIKLGETADLSDAVFGKFKVSKTEKPIYTNLIKAAIKQHEETKHESRN